jgi:serine protease
MILNNLFFGLLICGIVSAQSNRFILTSKSRGKRLNLSSSKIKGNAKFNNGNGNGNIEFFFVQNLTIQDITDVSKDFLVEKDEKVSINWHLDRIDQRNLPLSNTVYNGNSSNLIDMYIVDTGVFTSHIEFIENNPIWGGNFVNDNIDTDCNGHGTHVASLAVGKDYGSGKKANLIAVKVLGCDGSGFYSGIIQAIEWITNRSSTSGKLSIVNMSLGGPSSKALDTAITNSFNTGVYYVVAAGNSNANACNYSPARVPSVVTVAASSITDTKASFSNHGTCIDVYAPGVNVVGAWLNNAYATLSGTSMSSPVAAGVLASYLSQYGRSGYNTFYSSMTSNVIIKNPKRTVNKLVYYI